MFSVRALRRRIQRSLHRVQPGMTLLEIMIVLAILALVMGMIVGPSVMEHFRKSKTHIAEMTIKKYAYQAYPEWAAAHPGTPCPSKLEELDEFIDRKDTKDPWGGNYKLYCGANLPPDAKGLAVSSPGEDGKEGTADDVQSWN